MFCVVSTKAILVRAKRRFLCLIEMPHAFFVLIFILSGFICYWGTLKIFFLSDDFDLILRVSRQGPFGIWSWRSNFFRPLTSLNLWCNLKLCGLNPMGYHLLNLLFHFLNSLFVSVIALLFVAESKIFRPYKKAVFYLSGLTFLLLPCHTEAVSWIACRGDLNATFFILFSFCMYLLYKLYHKKLCIVVSLLLFFCALMSKESVITYPLLIFLYEIYYCLFYKKRNSRILRSPCLTPLYIVILGIYLLFRRMALGTLIGGYGREAHLNFDLDLIFRNFIIYSTRVFLPPMPGLDFNFWTFTASGLGVIYLICFATCYFRGYPYRNILKNSFVLCGRFYNIVYSRH